MVTQGLSLKYKLQLGRTHILTVYLFLLSTANYKVAQRGWVVPGCRSRAGVVNTSPAIGAVGVLKYQQLIVLRVEHLRRDSRDSGQPL